MKNTTILLAVLLTACAIPAKAPTDLRAGLRAQGATEAYIDGAADGCPSGYATENYMMTGYRKDLERAAVDAQYAMGWADWYENCARRMRARLR